MMFYVIEVNMHACISIYVWTMVRKKDIFIIYFKYL
jgi:hypothetical protein